MVGVESELIKEWRLENIWRFSLEDTQAGEHECEHENEENPDHPPPGGKNGNQIEPLN